jgi:hypothetical protein
MTTVLPQKDLSAGLAGRMARHSLENARAQSMKKMGLFSGLKRENMFSAIITGILLA